MTPEDLLPTRWPFRLLAVLLLGLLMYELPHRYPLPGVSETLGLACYWLMLVGVLGLMLTEEPLKAGAALLTTLAGFELFYVTMERSLAVTGLWAAILLLIALAVAYLTVVRVGAPEGGR